MINIKHYFFYKIYLTYEGCSEIIEYNSFLIKKQILVKIGKNIEETPTNNETKLYYQTI